MNKGGQSQDPGKKIPSSEDYLREHTIGELKPLPGPIQLADYDPEWPRRFEELAVRIQSALGACALRVEHVGSTAIPGLVAKPVLDILLVVPNSAKEADYAPALEAAWFLLRIREPEWHEHRMFKSPENDVNLHVFSDGCVEIERMLAFRDHLRTCKEDRDLYAATKRTLAEQSWTYTQQYADAKTAVIDQILSRATRAKP